MTFRHSLAVLATVPLVFAGCPDDGTTPADPTDVATADSHEHDTSAGDASGQPDFGNGEGVSTGGALTTEDLGEGVILAVVDATDGAVWVYIDLETGMQVAPSDAANSTEWDLGLQRFRIKTNGGISGSGGMTGVAIAGSPFDDVMKAPGDGWLSDAEDGSDTGEDPDTVFNGSGDWYEYDPVNHTLTARADRTHIVQTVEGNYYKVAVLDYYDEAGTSAIITLKWATVDGPPTGPTIPDDAVEVTTEPGATSYLDLAAGAAVEPSNPADDTTWDLHVTGIGLGTNSGDSGPGMGGARVATEAASYDDLTAVDTVGFSVDAMIGMPGPPGSPMFAGNQALTDWFAYNPMTHTLAPVDQVYAVRTADGGYAKLKVVHQVDNSFYFLMGSIDRAVMTHTLNFSAPSSGDWVYLSLRSGGIVEVTEPETSLAWDLAVNGVNMRTNSGTSGVGQGGAWLAEVDAIASVTEAPTDGYDADTMVPVPGPPGSGEMSGNAALGGWYDYDPVNHVASPAAKVFVVRLADGSFAKLQVTAYADGDYTMDFAYAGPGHTSF